MIATIRKVRYLTSPTFHVEVQYTVEGSDKVYKHTMSKSHKLSDWRREEIHQLSKHFWDKMKSMGDGCHARILYDGSKSKKVLQFEIQTGLKHFYLKAI
jgi:hypothetical protein